MKPVVTDLRPRKVTGDFSGAGVAVLAPRRPEASSAAATKHEPPHASMPNERSSRRSVRRDIHRPLLAQRFWSGPPSLSRRAMDPLLGPRQRLVEGSSLAILIVSRRGRIVA